MGILKAFSFYETEVQKLFCPYGLLLELLQPPSARPQGIASGNYSVYMHILKYVFFFKERWCRI